ncbi:MAG TPA: protein-disulfide reductase DsbD domain-containing protein [Gemmatimonadales bacterium]
MRPSLFLVAALAAAPGAGAQETVANPHVVISLVPEHHAATPGQPLRLALRFQPEPGWHIYWRNPGQAGIATSVAWTVPPGFRTDSLAWPVPELYDIAGILTHVMHGETVLRTTVLVPLVVAASPARIGAEVRYGVCKEVCLPGVARLSLQLGWATPGSRESSVVSREWTAVQQTSEARQPRAGGPAVAVRLADTVLVLTVRAKPGQALPDTLTFYASDRDVATAAVRAVVRRGATTATLRVPLRATPSRVRGVLVGGSPGAARPVGWAVDLRVEGRE